VSLGDAGENTGVGFATARGRNWPTLRQFTVFLENRVGQLLEVVRRFEGSRVRIVALSITDAGGGACVSKVISRWYLKYSSREAIRLEAKRARLFELSRRLL